MTTVWVPADAAAVSVGADEVAEALHGRRRHRAPQRLPRDALGRAARGGRDRRWTGRLRQRHAGGRRGRARG